MNTPAPLAALTRERIEELREELLFAADYMPTATTTVLSALCDMALASLQPSESGEHWVFAAAIKSRGIAERVPLGIGLPWGKEHLLYMLDQLEKREMSPTKACRWFGWIQACICFSGVASLEDMKAMNKDAAALQAKGRSTAEMSCSELADRIKRGEKWKIADPSPDFRAGMLRAAEICEKESDQLVNGPSFDIATSIGKQGRIAQAVGAGNCASLLRRELEKK